MRRMACINFPCLRAMSDHDTIFLLRCAKQLEPTNRNILIYWAISPEGYSFFERSRQLFLKSVRSEEILVSFIGMDSYSDACLPEEGKRLRKDTMHLNALQRYLYKEIHQMFPADSLERVKRAFIASSPFPEKGRLYSILVEPKIFRPDPLEGTLLLYYYRRLHHQETHASAFAATISELNRSLADLQSHTLETLIFAPEDNVTEIEQSEDTLEDDHADL